MIGVGIGLGFGQALKKFLPTQLTGCVLWLRADTAYSAGTWTDQSGVGDANHNVTQATSGKRPTLNASDAAYNNKATLSFAAASSQFLQSGNWSTTMTQPWTLVIVGNDDGVTANQWWFDNNQSPETELFDPGSTYEFNAGATLNSGVAKTSSPLIFIVTASGGTGSMYVSAKTAKVTGNIGSQGWTGITLGTFFGATSFFLNGKMAEVIAYNRALSTGEINSTLGYAGTRYGIAIGA